MNKNSDCEFNKPAILYCSFCNKECHSLNSLKQHECRCKENPNRRNYDNFKNCTNIIKKGDTWKTNPIVAKCRDKLISRYNEGYISPRKGKPGTFKGKHHTEQTKQRIGNSVSKSRIEGYANGKITPAKGVGKGKYSYIEYNNKTYMLRSTYEFIYALYLIYNHVNFELESIRVPAIKENPYGKTFISDFSYDNKVIEIKGISSGKDKYIKESFETAGYEFIELFEKDIEECKNFLIAQGLPIDNLIQLVIDGHNSKNYFKYIV